jgi:hypothetical protein
MSTTSLSLSSLVELNAGGEVTGVDSGVLLERLDLVFMRFLFDLLDVTSDLWCACSVSSSLSITSA